MLAVLVSPARVYAFGPPGLRYAIDVRLDPLRHRLSGHATILYRSGADSALPHIYLHAYPNAFRGPRTILGREGERWGEDYALRFASARERGWMTMDSVTADGRPAAVMLDETVARVGLPRPLEPGDSVTLRLRFDVQVPKPFDRFGHVGGAYSIGQWYPKVAVYDDLGWHADPYHYFAEFYGDYGTFDVAITLPDRYWVGATGVLTGAEGGDNEIPLADQETPRDSVTVEIRAVTADSLRGKWPQTTLEVETDLAPPKGKKAEPVEVKRDSGARLRVPRGAPVHYAYRWGASKDESREEADDAGRPGPLHLLIASRDTALVDTLHALARGSSPKDSVLPSLKTLRFHAERVHDFAWVACPDYVRGDTAWSGIAIRSLVFRDDQNLWSGQKEMTASALEFMSQEVGPYIWPSFTSAEAYVGGGAMEYPMLIMNEPDQASAWTENLDMTIAHELGHNWFYGMLGSDERAFTWLDEGFTQYMEQRYAERKYPRGIFKRRRLIPWLSPIRDLDLNENRYLARAWARDEERMSTPADQCRSWSTYSVASYNKATCMLHTLRGYLGDSTFDAFLHEYYRRNLLKHPRAEDVVKAVEAVTGRDLAGFFHEWVDGVGRPSFALGGVRRERSQGGYRSTVTVRRVGEMPLPVTVEARFADGTREERRVFAGDRETKAVFESRARLTRAVLDPRHEIVEMNRLDNRAGLFLGLWPPMRFKPLFDVPTSDAITAAYGPTIWHGRSEGFRLGLWLDARYLPSVDFPEGIRRMEGGVSAGTRDGSVAWRVGMARRWGTLGARAIAKAQAVRDEGMLRAGLRAGNKAMALGRRHPYRSWKISLQYRDRYDLAPVDPRYWSPGRAVHATGEFTVETQGFRRAERVSLDLRRGFSAFRSGGDSNPDVQYDRASIEARQTLDLLPRGSTHVSWRFFAGSSFRRVPRELLFDAAEGGRLDSLERFYLNDRGPLLASGRYLVAGGGGLRGYRGRAALGKRVWGLSVDLSAPLLPIALFGDLGRIEATGVGESAAAGASRSDLTGRALADAGVAYEVGPFKLTVPLWVGRPEPDEQPWRFRWLVSIGSILMPF